MRRKRHHPARTPVSSSFLLNNLSLYLLSYLFYYVSKEKVGWLLGIKLICALVIITVCLLWPHSQNSVPSSVSSCLAVVPAPCQMAICLLSLALKSFTTFSSLLPPCTFYLLLLVFTTNFSKRWFMLDAISSLNIDIIFNLSYLISLPTTIESALWLLMIRIY